ncbi:hypothetical protein Mal15_42550 [Stieleria maiorica]|uniref:Uncharacterized protein n=1 Tax=Stieleria maiorica TaxID=2795974 RepID=A0A5B9MKQ6_9BACT|nr:hypothetical protein [Stieleria maiorica]QEG00186.1 hypothetical protein Mal15_42550 [Stieleria maiorica]
MPLPQVLVGQSRAFFVATTAIRDAAATRLLVRFSTAVDLTTAASEIAYVRSVDASAITKNGTGAFT